MNTERYESVQPRDPVRVGDILPEVLAQLAHVEPVLATDLLPWSPTDILEKMPEDPDIADWFGQAYKD